MADQHEMQELAQAKQDLTNEERIQFDLQFAASRKNPTYALIFGIFWGLLGVDRFYIGDTGLGFAKLFTLGGVVIWAFIDLFLIQRAARAKNSETIQQIRESILMMRPA